MTRRRQRAPQRVNRNENKSYVIRSMTTKPMIRRRCMELRLQGLDYYEIGLEMGLTRQAVSYHVKKEMERIDEEREEAAKDVLQMDLSRLDQIYREMFDEVERTKNPKAAQQCLAVIKQRADLVGLNAPKKHDVSVDWLSIIEQEEEDENDTDD